MLGCAENATVVAWRSEPDARSVVRSAAGDREVLLYHWAPLTSGSRSFAAWPLLLPFTLVNVAGWMAPPGRSSARRTLHRVGTVWVGMATTAAVVVWLLVAAMAVWGKVAGPSPGAATAPGAVSGLIFSAAAASAAVGMAVLVAAATYTADGFERFRPWTWLGPPRAWKWPWGVGVTARLDDPQFYDNGTEHKVRWRLHVAVAVATFVVVVLAVYTGGTERAGHLVGRAVLAVGLAEGLGVALIAVAGVWPAEGDDRRLSRRLLGAATAVLGVVLLGGLVLSALISFTGIGQVPPGAVAVLYDAYGWGLLAGAAAAILCVLRALATPIPAEKGPSAALLPTIGARLRARLATILSDVDRVVSVLAPAFGVAGGIALVTRWSAVSHDAWRLTASPPVNFARSTFAFVLAFAVLNLVKSRASPAALKRIGNVWDILTFWPRAFHPFAVRPYAERAVPELQEFLRAAPRHDPMVVAAHSQGTVLAYAAIRPFVTSADRALPPLSLVTFGSPLRSLYAAVFPYYFDVGEFEATRRRVAGGWVNCFRLTDHVGRAVFVTDAQAVAGPPGGPDRPIPDAGPPDHRVNGHNDYWPEPAVREAVAAAAQTPATVEL